MASRESVSLEFCWMDYSYFWIGLWFMKLENNHCSIKDSAIKINRNQKYQHINLMIDDYKVGGWIIRHTLNCYSFLSSANLRQKYSFLFNATDCADSRRLKARMDCMACFKELYFSFIWRICGKNILFLLRLIITLNLLITEVSH